MANPYDPALTTSSVEERLSFLPLPPLVTPVSVAAKKTALSAALAEAVCRVMSKKYTMCSRVVALLLLPAFLLSQWVMVCRCTGGCRAAGHDARPHVHVHDLIPAQSPKKCRCCQQTEPERTTHSESDGTPHPSAADSPDQGDDAGIIYLPASVVFGPRPVTGVDTDSVLHDLAGPPDGACLARHGPDKLALPAHGPPARRPARRPIYILTLSLLI